jgi:hypothetical protein
LRSTRTDPENRPFAHSDPIEWTEENRAKILRALYTILLGNPELNKSPSAPAKTRFKLWWRLVGAAIENAAKCSEQSIDFQQLFLDQESDEEDSASLADTLSILNKRWPGRAFKAAEVADLIKRMAGKPRSALRCGNFYSRIRRATLLFRPRLSASG